VNSGDCKEYNQIVQGERASKPPRVVQEATRQIKCSPAQVVSAPQCDHEALAEKGREFHAAGQFGAAMDQFEKAWNCKQDPQYAEKAFIPACNLTNVAKAKLYWKRMSAALRQRAVTICIRNGITEDTLNGP